METKEDEVDTTNEGMIFCCPRCKSRNIILGDSKEGYYWVYLCNNCGYRGKEGDKMGCLDKTEPDHVRE